MPPYQWRQPDAGAATAQARRGISLGRADGGEEVK